MKGKLRKNTEGKKKDPREQISKFIVLEEKFRSCINVNTKISVKTNKIIGTV